MPKVIQIIDVDAEGHKLRLDNGDIVRTQHPYVPHLGEELGVDPTHATPPTVEQMNSAAQVEANILSEVVKDAVEPAGSVGENVEGEHTEAQAPVE